MKQSNLIKREQTGQSLHYVIKSFSAVALNIKQNTKTVSLSVTLPVTLSASESLSARTECMKTVVFVTRRRERVVVTPVGVTNNMTFCYVSVN